MRDNFKNVTNLEYKEQNQKCFKEQFSNKYSFMHFSLKDIYHVLKYDTELCYIFQHNQSYFSELNNSTWQK